ncbi:MAG TPA: hypothetical protein VLY24_08250 [Bryobacteraceae bacterium]|nr:hypothetical protein [Bryobacteraceae bacterium]
MPAALLFLFQMGAIEIHPWDASIDAIGCPNRLVFDLGFVPDVPFEAVKLAALDIHAPCADRKPSLAVIRF